MYALAFKLLGLRTVAQCYLCLLYSTITLPTLLNRVEYLTQVETYTCVACTTNTCTRIFPKKICLC